MDGLSWACLCCGEITAPESGGECDEARAGEDDRGRLGRGWGDGGEEPALLAVDTGGNVEGVSVDVGTTGAEFKRPQAIVDQRQAVGAKQRAKETAGAGEGVDSAVAEVADEEIAPKRSEAGRRDGDSP